MDSMVQLGPEGRAGVPDDVAHAKASTSGLILFNNRICPFGQRAWWSLLEKGLTSADFEYIHIELGKNKPTWYAEVNASGTVPCIYNQGRAVFESAICAEWAEDAFPGRGTALMPADAWQRSQVRLAIAAFGEKVVGKLYGYYRNSDDDREAALRRDLEVALQSLDAMYARQRAVSAHTGPYFLGAELSLADICIVPFLLRFEALLSAYKSASLADMGAPLLLASLEACKARPAFATTAQTPDFFIEAYREYRDPAPAKKEA